MVWVVKLLLFQVHIHTETVWVARGPSTRDQPFWSSYNRTNKTKSCSTSTSNKTLSAAVCIYCQFHIFIFLFCIEATTLLFCLCEREKQNYGPNEHGIEEEQNSKNINRNKHNLKKKNKNVLSTNKRKWERTVFRKCQLLSLTVGSALSLSGYLHVDARLLLSIVLFAPVAECTARTTLNREFMRHTQHTETYSVTNFLTNWLSMCYVLSKRRHSLPVWHWQIEMCHRHEVIFFSSSSSSLQLLLLFILCRSVDCW